MSLKNKLAQCIKEGEKGERHKGLKKIEPNKELIDKHINKAVHNFKLLQLLRI